VLKYSLGTGNFSGKVNAPWGANDVMFIAKVRLLFSRDANLLRAFYAELEVQVVSKIMSYFKKGAIPIVGTKRFLSIAICGQCCGILMNLIRWWHCLPRCIDRVVEC